MKAAHADWGLQTYTGSAATKATLATLLGGDQTPSLLFTTSHGMNFGKDKPRQLGHQGALLCGDWPGPVEWTKAIPQDFYFAGDDLKAEADLLGLVAFFFACYGGGTPQYNEFTHVDSPGAKQPTRTEIASFPFLARLPVRMLGRSRGALAVVGHVERAWTYSFKWPKAGSQTTVFESTLDRLLKGYPIGYALEYFNERYAELSVELSDALEEISFGQNLRPIRHGRDVDGQQRRAGLRDHRRSGGAAAGCGTRRAASRAIGDRSNAGPFEARHPIRRRSGPYHGGGHARPGGELRMPSRPGL